MINPKRPARGSREPARGRRARATALAGVAALAGASTAHAENDGAYGRLDGDLDLRAGAGASLAAGGPALSARAAAVYLQTAGLYAHYTDALGAEGTPVARSIAGGVLLQPLFLARYASDLERGPPWLDLFLDSVALGVGSFWEAPPRAGLAPEPGLELSLSLDVPLLGDATGPFIGLRGALRFRGPELAGAESARDAQRALLSVTLSWHHVLRVHIVDAGDRSYARGRAPAEVAARGGAAARSP